MIRYASFYGLFLVATAGLALAVVSIISDVPFSGIAGAVAFICLLFLLLLGFYILSNKPAIPHWVLSLLVLVISMTPTFYFIAIDQALPDGAATYFNGPINSAYFPFLVMVSLLFDMRYSIVAGILAMAGYLLSFWLSKDALAGMTTANPEMLRMMSTWGPNIIKGFIIFGFSVLAGYISIYTRRILLKLLEEQEEKDNIKRTFGQFVSDEVREKILSLSNEVGEKTEAAILFSDIRGFTSLTEKSDASELLEQLNDYFDAMVAAIQKHGGIVDKFVGDAIMANFGGVQQLPNAAQAAVEAGQAMLLELDQLNSRWQNEGRGPWQMGIGIHIDEVLQGVVGAKDRKEYTVIGDGVNMASRLEGLSKKLGTSLVFSEAVKNKLSADIETRALGTAQLRGKSNQVQVYSVL